jgi:hypothetical protein
VQDLLKPKSEDSGEEKSGADQLKDAGKDLFKGILQKSQ